MAKKNKKKDNKDVVDNLHKADEKHEKETMKYLKMIEKLYNDAIAELSVLAMKIDGIPLDQHFSFDFHKGVSKEADSVIRNLASKITAVATMGSRSQWLAACEKSDQFIESIAKTSNLTQKTLKGYKDRNLEGLAAFQKRKIDGLDLAGRIWKHVAPLKDEVELVTDTTAKYYKHGINSGKTMTKFDRAIGTGTSAQQLSQDIRSCLKEPNKLFRRVRDKNGNLQLSKAAKLYHPGQGVYRSSYKNAMRVARSEINMAYRQSDYDRWQKLDWVIGIKIQLSNNHTTRDPKGKGVIPLVDICDELVGNYPKNFKFVGWHPQCRCFVTPIMINYEDLDDDREVIDDDTYKQLPHKDAVTDMPDNFKKYIADNAERIEGWKSFPYYIKDNTEKVVGSLCEIPQNGGFDQMIKQRSLASSLLRKDKNYVDVKFDKANGGLVATHKDHHFDAVGGSYEKNVQNAGFLDSHAVIFTSEKNGKLNQRFTEGLWDGKEFEVMGCETATVNNVFRGLKHSAKKGSTKIALLDFPNGGFDENNLELALRKYYGLEKLNDGQFLQFERLVCVQGKKIVYDKPFEKKGTGGSVNRSTPRSAKVNKTSGTENIQNNKNATNSSNAANLTNQPYKRTQEEILAAAKQRQSQRTQEQREEIQKAWDERKKNMITPHHALKKKYNSDAEVDETFRVINSELPDGSKWFEHGDLKMRVTYSPGVNGQTNMRGIIELRPERLKNVKAALEKIAAGKYDEITFDEADSMATFWHEIAHNRNKIGNMYLTDAQTKFMELANEYIARHSLPEFYRVLGCKDTPHTEFITNRKSTGYNTRVTNYQHVVSVLKLDESKVLDTVKKWLYEKRYDEQDEGLIQALLDGGLQYCSETDSKGKKRKSMVPKTSELKRLLKSVRDQGDVYGFDSSFNYIVLKKKEEVIEDLLVQLGFLNK